MVLVAGSILSTPWPTLSVTQIAWPSTARSVGVPYGAWKEFGSPMTMVAATVLVAGSTRATTPADCSKYHTAPAPARAPMGKNPIGTRLRTVPGGAVAGFRRARRGGCSATPLGKLESEDRRPSQQIAQRLADLLEVAPDARAAFLRFARGAPFAAPASAADQPAEHGPAGVPNNLPHPFTSFVG